MSVTAVEYDLADLLRRVGARIRGRDRADCPRCKRQRSIAFDESRGVYHCHGQACDFSGGAVKLARHLGFAKQLTPAEYRRLRQERERADRAARALYKQAKARRFKILDELRSLNRVELGAHAAGIDHPATWRALSLVYGERPRMLAELAFLESAPAGELIRFLTASAETHGLVVDRVIADGGVQTFDGKWVEVCDASPAEAIRRFGRTE